MKLCKDCKHRRGHYFSKCAAPQNRVISLVTGRWSYGRWKYCSAQRIGNSNHESCGEQGAWWEPREPSVVQRVIKIFTRS